MYRSIHGIKMRGETFHYQTKGMVKGFAGLSSERTIKDVQKLTILCCSLII